MLKNALLIILFLFGSIVIAQTNVYAQRVLIVTAHPDDESACAATVYKITKELNGVVDLAVITNGEGGYKYSLLAEAYYHIKLTDEATGRKHLPSIRKKELMAAGDIIGISNYFFFDQLDHHYTLDVDTVLKETWDTTLIKKHLKSILSKGNYDFIFCLLPTPGTHGHHKGAAILALETLNEIQGNKPVILGVTTNNETDTVPVFKGLEKFPLTSISSGTYFNTVDRTVSFGYKNSLNYKIVVNWEIVEHKSQGSIQSTRYLSDLENFWYFDCNGQDGKKKTEGLFEKLKNWKY
jgi:LmbE family N-acetylglucosaminyl deacetylase